MPDAFACPRCGFDGTVVADSEPSTVPVANLRRLRSCPDCGHSFGTREVADDLAGREFVELTMLTTRARQAVRQIVQCLEVPAEEIVDG